MVFSPNVEENLILKLKIYIEDGQKEVQLVKKTCIPGDTNQHNNNETEKDSGDSLEKQENIVNLSMNLNQSNINNFEDNSSISDVHFFKPKNHETFVKHHFTAVEKSLLEQNIVCDLSSLKNENTLEIPYVSTISKAVESTKCTTMENEFSSDTSSIDWSILPNLLNPSIYSVAFNYFNCKSQCRNKICQKVNLPVDVYEFVHIKMLHFGIHKKAVLNPVTFEQIGANLKEDVCYDSRGDRDVSKESTFSLSFNSLSGSEKHDFTSNVVFYRDKGPEDGVRLCDSCFLKVLEVVDAKSPDKTKLEEFKETSCFFNRCFKNSQLVSAENDSNNNIKKEIGDSPVLKKCKTGSIKKLCEAISSHLLNENSVDSSELNRLVKSLRHTWLKAVGNKFVALETIRYFLDYFKTFSESLLKMIVCTTDVVGNNVLHFAFSNNRFDIAGLFFKYDFIKKLLKMKNDAGHTAFMVCAISEPQTEKDWKIIYRAMQHVDINQSSEYNGQTPLMNAARNGSELMVQLLLDFGADPNIQDIDGSTALMYAAEYGQKKCVHLLLNHLKCDPTIKDYDKVSACSVALYAGHKDIALQIFMQAKNNPKNTSTEAHSFRR